MFHERLKTTLQVTGTRPSVERLHELFTYCDDGRLKWKVRNSNRAPAGTHAGSISKHGYRTIGIDGRDYRAAMIVWAMHTGEWPDKFVDHKNRDRLDDRMQNLRLASHADNAANCSNKGATSKIVGVSFDRTRQKWLAQIMRNGKTKYLGRYDSEIDAAGAYRKAAAAVHGEFASL
jgi:hypothetical protein